MVQEERQKSMLCNSSREGVEEVTCATDVMPRARQCLRAVLGGRPSPSGRLAGDMRLKGTSRCKKQCPCHTGISCWMVNWLYRLAWPGLAIRSWFHGWGFCFSLGNFLFLLLLIMSSLSRSQMFLHCSIFSSLFLLLIPYPQS